ncbi:MAG: hypothetical protein JWN04_2710 [Myxococcaceae bacterium]|nr:hypothetical protein [Myxococcaceae bacterium]
MRLLQIVRSTSDMSVAPRDPANIATMRKSIRDEIASGALLATGGLAKSATSAARVTRRAGQTTVEDPPAEAGWMAGGGYSLVEYASKEEAIERASRKLELMGEGMRAALRQLHDAARRQRRRRMVEARHRGRMQAEDAVRDRALGRQVWPAGRPVRRDLGIQHAGYDEGLTVRKV